MTDRLSKEHRSWNMSQIRSRDTTPERIVRSLLHAMGFRFRLHLRKLPGCPDIVLAKWRTAIFVNGCFWHRHHGCKQAYTPKTREVFWLKKLNANIARDARTLAALRKQEWKALVIWECELKDTERLSHRLYSAIRGEESA